LPPGAWPVAAAVVAADDPEVISAERRALFMPPAPRRGLLEAEPSPA
jgi:hypothetical protein